MSESLQSAARAESWFTSGAELLRKRFIDAVAADSVVDTTLGLPSGDQLARFNQTILSELSAAQVEGTDGGTATILALACTTHEATHEVLESIVLAFKAQVLAGDSSALSQTVAYQILHVESDRLGLLSLILEVLKEVLAEQAGNAGKHEGRVAQVGLVSQALVRELVGLVYDLRARAEVKAPESAVGQALIADQFGSWEQAAAELAKFNAQHRSAADSSGSQVARICQELGIAGN